LFRYKLCSPPVDELAATLRVLRVVRVLRFINVSYTTLTHLAACAGFVALVAALVGLAALEIDSTRAGPARMASGGLTMLLVRVAELATETDDEAVISG
jgi:hypothetical protein